MDFSLSPSPSRALSATDCDSHVRGALSGRCAYLDRLSTCVAVSSLSGLIRERGGFRFRSRNPPQLLPFSDDQSWSVRCLSARPHSLLPRRTSLVPSSTSASHASLSCASSHIALIASLPIHLRDTHFAVAFANRQRHQLHPPQSNPLSSSPRQTSAKHRTPSPGRSPLTIAPPTPSKNLFDNLQNRWIAGSSSSRSEIAAG